MLNLPPKLQQAFDQGNFEPVTYAEISTKTIDQPSELAPSVIAIQGSLNIPISKKNIEMSYPDAVATATQITLGVNGTLGDVGQGSLYVHSRKKRFFGGRQQFTGLVRWQTFTAGEDNLQANRLKSVTVKLRREGSINAPGTYTIEARLYNAVDGYPIGTGRAVTGVILSDRGGHDEVSIFGLLDTGGISKSITTVDARNIPSFYIDVAFTFNDNLVGGNSYAIVLTMTAINVPKIEHFDIKWRAAYPGNSGEFSGPHNNNFTTNRFFDHSLFVNFATYKTSPVPILQIQFDMGLVPEEIGFWDILDQQVLFTNPVSGLSESTNITYHAWAGNTQGAKTIDLGPVVSFDIIPITALKRYYVLEVTFSATPNGLRTPQFNTARPRFPALVTRFSSHPITIDGNRVIPAIVKTPIIPTKMDIRSNITQRGGIKLDLIDLDGSVSRMAIEENLINVPVEVRFGHSPTATSKTDLILLYKGVVKDYSYQEGKLSLSIENYSINLKRKIPIIQNNTIQARFSENDIRRDFRNMTLAAALKRVIRAARADRFMDEASIDLAETRLQGNNPDNLFITSRILSKQIEANKAVTELLQLMGASLVEQEDGRMVVISFPITTPHIGTWDESIVAEGEVQLASISRTLTNLVIVHYDTDSEGESRSIMAVADGDSISEWGPGSDEHVADFSIKTGWLGDEPTFHGKSIAQRIGQRMVSILKNGLISIKFSTSIVQYDAQVGERVWIVTPVFLRKGILGSSSGSLKSFVLVEKKPNIDNGTIQWIAVEDIQINNPPTARFSSTVTSGIPTFSVTIDTTTSVAEGSASLVLFEIDFDYDGENFTTDNSSTTPAFFGTNYTIASIGFKAIALRVTDSNGLQDISTKFINGEPAIIRVKGQPVAEISADISSPDQPLLVVLNSISRGTTSVIAVTEWDLSYDGISFNTEVFGNSALVNLPYQKITVALRVTDEDGLVSEIVTQEFIGKLLAPAQVIEFFVDQSTSQLSFTWSKNTEPDIKGYEIREGSAWNASVLIANDIQTSHVMTAAPASAGTYSYMIRAVNTTGRKSITETIAIVIVLDPGDRTVLNTATNPTANGWLSSAGTSGLFFDVEGNRWWIESTAGHVTQGDTTPSQGDTRATVLAGVRTEGVFEGSSVDFGQVIQARISVNPTFNITPDPDGTSALIEVRLHDGTAWGTYSAAKQADLRFQAYQPRITLKNLDGASNISLTGFSSCVDARDIFDSGEDVSVSSSGVTAIAFNRLFHNVGSAHPRPTVKIAINNMTVPIYERVENITNTGFNLRLFLVSDNTQVGGVVDWVVKGV